MLFDSFDSSCSFETLQKYLKIYFEDKLHRVSFLSELFLVWKQEQDGKYICLQAN